MDDDDDELANSKTNERIQWQPTIHLRRPWTSAFFRLASGTVGFSPRLKNSGHVITFLLRCGLQNTDHVIPFWPLKWTACLMFFPPLSVQRKERCPLYLALINRAGGLYGRILTEVVSTDRTQWGLYTRPRSRFSHTDRLSSVKKMFIIWRKQEPFNSFNVTGL